MEPGLAPGFFCPDKMGFRSNPAPYWPMAIDVIGYPVVEVSVC
jgi:hypothetical protein